MRRHAVLTTTVVTTAVALLAGPLLPGPAHAATTPQLVYLDTAAGQVVTSPLGEPSPSPTAVSPSGVTALLPAVSADGTVVAYGVQTGPASAVSTTWGLYVSKAGVTRIVTDVWDTRPAIDGIGTVWWLARSDLWKYVPSTGVSTRVCSSCVTDDAGTRSPNGLAVSADATTFAVTFRTQNPSDGSLAVYALSGGTLTRQHVFTNFDSEYLEPTFGADADELAVAWIPVAAGQIQSAGAQVKRVTRAGSPASWTLHDTLTPGYSPSYLDGVWYAVTDGPSDTSVVSSTSDLDVAPTAVGSIAHWSTTGGYRVTGGVPAVSKAPAPLPATAELDAPARTEGKVSVYGWRSCSLAACDKDYVSVAGVLQSSTNGRTWRTVATNKFPAKTSISRTTRFVWLAPRTATLAAAVSPVRTVVYIPTFDAGTLTTTSVSGSFTRKKGTVVLQVLKKKRWKDTRATASMSKKGRFTLHFAFSPGTKYAIRTVADRKAGVGISGWFRI